MLLEAEVDAPAAVADRERRCREAPVLTFEQFESIFRAVVDEAAAGGLLHISAQTPTTRSAPCCRTRSSTAPTSWCARLPSRGLEHREHSQKTHTRPSDRRGQ